MDPISELHISSKGKGRKKDTLILVYPTEDKVNETVLYQISEVYGWGYDKLNKLASEKASACVTASALDAISRGVIAFPEEGIRTEKGAKEYLKRIFTHVTTD